MQAPARPSSLWLRALGASVLVLLAGGMLYAVFVALTNVGDIGV